MGVKMYVPSGRVMRVSVKAWPSCVSVTLAPEMTAPEPSLMVPRIVPVSTWAKAVVAATHRHRAATAVRAPFARERMPNPPLPQVGIAGFARQRPPDEEGQSSRGHRLVFGSVDPNHLS